MLQTDHVREYIFRHTRAVLAGSTVVSSLFNEGNDIHHVVLVKNVVCLRGYVIAPCGETLSSFTIALLAGNWHSVGPCHDS